MLANEAAKRNVAFIMAQAHQKGRDISLGTGAFSRALGKETLTINYSYYAISVEGWGMIFYDDQVFPHHEIEELIVERITWIPELTWD